MPATRTPGKPGSRRSQTLNSRGRSLLVAGACAVLAGVLIYLFVSHYNKSSNQTVAQVTVYQASKYIPAGTPQALVAQQGLLKPVQVPSKQVPLGAITNPGEITGEVASAPITAGTTITTANFTHSAVTISSYLRGDERAVGFALDPPHGLTAYIAQGSTVDVMGQNQGTAEVLVQNVTVLANANGDVVLRVTDKQALALAAATGISNLWLALRPVTGATDSVKLGGTGKA